MNVFQRSLLDVPKKSENYLPSSHSGGELPGNQRGRSGGSGSQTLDTPFVAFTRVLTGELALAANFPGNHFLGLPLSPGTQGNAQKARLKNGNSRGPSAKLGKKGAASPTWLGGWTARKKQRLRPWMTGGAAAGAWDCLPTPAELKWMKVADSG